MPGLTAYILLLTLLFHAIFAKGQFYKFRDNAKKRDSSRFNNYIKPYWDSSKINIRYNYLDSISNILLIQTSRDSIRKLIESMVPQGSSSGSNASKDKNTNTEKTDKTTSDNQKKLTVFLKA